MHSIPVYYSTIFGRTFTQHWMCESFVIREQLNGNNGSYTGSDDVADYIKCPFSTPEACAGTVPDHFHRKKNRQGRPLSENARNALRRLHELKEQKEGKKPAVYVLCALPPELCEEKTHFHNVSSQSLNAVTFMSGVTVAKEVLEAAEMEMGEPFERFAAKNEVCEEERRKPLAAVQFSSQIVQPTQRTTEAITFGTDPEVSAVASKATPVRGDAAVLIKGEEKTLVAGCDDGVEATGVIFGNFELVPPSPQELELKVAIVDDKKAPSPVVLEYQEGPILSPGVIPECETPAQFCGVTGCWQQAPCCAHVEAFFREEHDRVCRAVDTFAVKCRRPPPSPPNVPPFRPVPPIGSPPPRIYEPHAPPVLVRGVKFDKMPERRNRRIPPVPRVEVDEKIDPNLRLEKRMIFYTLDFRKHARWDNFKVWVRDHVPFLQGGEICPENTPGGFYVRDKMWFQSSRLRTHTWALPWSDHWNKPPKYCAKEFKDNSYVTALGYKSYHMCSIYPEMLRALCDLKSERYAALISRSLVAIKGGDQETGMSHFQDAVRSAAAKLKLSDLWLNENRQAYVNTCCLYVQQVLISAVQERLTLPSKFRPDFS